jgi:hypothetical protein
MWQLDPVEDRRDGFWWGSLKEKEHFENLGIDTKRCVIKNNYLS